MKHRQKEGKKRRRSGQKWSVHVADSPIKTSAPSISVSQTQHAKLLVNVTWLYLRCHLRTWRNSIAKTFSLSLFFILEGKLKGKMTSNPQSINGSESEFEFIETPKAPTPTFEKFEPCGVRTTAVSWWKKFQSFLISVNSDFEQTQRSIESNVPWQLVPRYQECSSACRCFWQW